MKAANPKLFNKEYYYNICLGSDEFKKSGGKKLHPKVKEMIDKLPLSPSMNVLEIGSGRGDTTLYVAKKVNSIIGIDYSSEAIKIANKIKKTFPSGIQKRASFLRMNATQLKFKRNTFDLVLLIDTFDHFESEQVKKVFLQIDKVLKDDGLIFIRTCSNKTLLCFTYPYYIRPLNVVLTWIDKKIKHIEYPSLPKDPRTREAKQQHVNEPTYFSLKKLFNSYGFEGSIHSEIGYIKEVKNMRGIVYNFIIALFPISRFFPLNIFFAYSFSSLLKKHSR